MTSYWILMQTNKTVNTKTSMKQSEYWMDIEKLLTVEVTMK